MNATDEYPQGPGRRLLRLPEVTHLVGLRRSAIYDKISKGEFPAPVHLGSRAVAWPSDRITAWIDARIGSSNYAVASRGAAR